MPTEHTTAVDGALPRALETPAPKLRHDFAAETLRSEKSIAKSHEFTNFIGSSISLPANWKNASTQGAGRSRLMIFNSPDSTAQMLLFDRGIPVKKESVAAFKKLLSENANLSRAKELPPSQIRKLSDVLGATTIGDNQFARSDQQPASRASAFHMFTAQLIPVNGKPVLEVQGNFLDQNGKKSKEYRGIFVGSGADGVTIKEFFIQAQNVVDLARHSRDYRQAVQSIKW